jgi:hypothetical protein
MKKTSFLHYVADRNMSIKSKFCDNKSNFVNGIYGTI